MLPLHQIRRGRQDFSAKDQWRNCFTWTSTGPAGVEITDHR